MSIWVHLVTETGPDMQSKMYSFFQLNNKMTLFHVTGMKQPVLISPVSNTTQSFLHICLSHPDAEDPFYCDTTGSNMKTFVRTWKKYKNTLFPWQQSSRLLFPPQKQESIWYEGELFFFFLIAIGNLHFLPLDGGEGHTCKAMCDCLGRKHLQTATNPLYSITMSLKSNRPIRYEFSVLKEAESLFWL